MKRTCVFLDRDGVINVKAPEGGYILNWDQFRFLPGIADWIRLFNALGHLVIVITNQRSVARGLITAGTLEDMHRRMIAELAAAGARIDDLFCCPHEEGTCDCRKPRPGLIRQALEKWNPDLSRSLFIGDSDSDEKLARTCGIPFLRVRNGRILPSVDLCR